VSPRDAMVILGHSNIAVTLGIYTHGDEDSRRDALDRLDQVLGLTSGRAGPAAATSAVVQDCPGMAVAWTDIPALSPREGSRPPAWQQMRSTDARPLAFKIAIAPGPPLATQVDAVPAPRVCGLVRLIRLALRR